MRLPHVPGFESQALQKYLKNTGALLLGKVGSQVIKMFVTLWVANYLLTYNNGLLNTTNSYIMLFAALATLGLDQFVVKELHAFPGKTNAVLGTAFILKLLAGLLLVPLIWLVWQFFSLQHVPYTFAFILSFTGVFQCLNVVESFYQANVQSKYIMRVQIGANIIMAVIKGLLILSHAPLIYFVYATLADTACIALGYLLSYRLNGYNISAWHFNFPLAKRLLGFSWPLIISGVMVSIYMRIDAIMLNKLLGERGTAIAGAYATVVSFSEALNFVPVAIVSSLFPAILNARRDNAGRYTKRLQNLYDLMVWISLGFALFITIASPYIYSLLKPAYAFAAPALAVHVWGSIFVFLGVASGQYLIAEDLSRLSFFRTGVGAVVNIVLNFLLIPKYGIMGTTIATVTAYFCAAFCIVFFKQLRPQAVMMVKSLFLVNTFKALSKRG